MAAGGRGGGVLRERWRKAGRGWVTAACRLRHEEALVIAAGEL